MKSCFKVRYIVTQKYDSGNVAGDWYHRPDTRSYEKSLISSEISYFIKNLVKISHLVDYFCDRKKTLVKN